MLESDLDKAAYRRFKRCTASLDEALLKLAYREAGAEWHDLAQAAAQRWRIDSHTPIWQRVEGELPSWL